MSYIESKSVDINSVFQDPANARTHSPEQLKSIAASLRRFGQQKPIVIDKEGVIVAGNGTHLAARDILGWTHIAACVSSLDAKEARAYGIADNQIATQSEWDLETLTRHIKDISDWNPLQDWSAIGFTEDAVEPLLAEGPTEEGVKAIEDFLNGAPEAKNTDEPPAMGQPIHVTVEMRETIEQAINIIRLKEGDYTMTEGRCIELMCADWLSGSLREYALNSEDK